MRRLNGKVQTEKQTFVDKVDKMDGWVACSYPKKESRNKEPGVGQKFDGFFMSL
tara:strand:+ start:777 stop:938 length:162 start_codon:yes stop_codon:yes gene_type:complete